jgi:hypothetical protein
MTAVRDESRGFLTPEGVSHAMTGHEESAEEAREMRRMKALPDLAAQVAQAAASVAKFSADRAAASDSSASRATASTALAQAGECVKALIELEASLFGVGDVPTIMRHVGRTLRVAASAVEAAGEAIELAGASEPAR